MVFLHLRLLDVHPFDPIIEVLLTGTSKMFTLNVHWGCRGNGTHIELQVFFVSLHDDWKLVLAFEVLCCITKHQNKRAAPNPYTTNHLCKALSSHLQTKIMEACVQCKWKVTQLSKPPVFEFFQIPRIFTVGRTSKFNTCWYRKLTSTRKLFDDNCRIWFYMAPASYFCSLGELPVEKNNLQGMKKRWWKYLMI